MHYYLFKDIKNRNKKAKELIEQGYIVRKSSTHNQLLHPEYVDDEHEYLRQQTGFGNTVYKAWYNTLYQLQVIGRKEA